MREADYKGLVRPNLEYGSSVWYLSIDTASPSLLSIIRRDACERIKVKK